MSRNDKVVQQKNLKLSDVIDQAEALLESKGLKAVLDFAARCNASDGNIALGQARVLTNLASKIQLQDPGRALPLLEKSFELAPDFVTPRAMACSLYDRTGQQQKGRQAALFILESQGASPEQKLVAADYLVRFVADSKTALDAAHAAFEALGCPLRWASLVLEIALKTGDWALVPQLTQQLTQAHLDGKDDEANEKPRTHLLWCANEEHNLKVVKNWNRRQLPLPKEPLPAPEIEPLVGRRLRVGYLSSDFREHPTSRLVNGLFRHHDRNVVEPFLYCSGWDDKSDMRREVVSHFEHVHSVQGITDKAAAEMIRSHKIDVLVELNGPTRAQRMGILAYRPAPVQIDYLGWPGSVGGRVVDYVVGDAYTVPLGAEKAYPEKVIRLDATYQVNDYAAQPRQPKVSRASQGLPEGVPVLGMFNAINKVREDVWAVWMRIMREVPDAILWTLDPGEHGRVCIAKYTKAHGVLPKRIFIAPPKKQKEHLARMQCADLMLDPWPYGGHTTTADALFAGVPVLALEGTNFAGRVSGGLLRAAGLPELVQPDTDAYVAKAVSLLRNPVQLQRLHQYLRDMVRSTNALDARGKARQFEAAYKIALERVMAGKKPVHINLQMPPGKATSAVPAAEIVSASVPISVVDWSKYKVAVVTPYFRIDPEKLKRCCDSVARQTFKCDHILVADGEPQAMPQGVNVIHMVLPANVGNSGATPRGFGAQYAFVQGYDAVAFLDADNWYDPDHIEKAVHVLEDDAQDVVFARRHVIFPDGEILQVDDPQDKDGGHVDTNCYVFSKRVAYLMSVWAMYPKEFGVGEDRLMRKIIADKKLKTKLIDKKTVWYETNWGIHFSLAKKTPLVPLRSPKKSFKDNFCSKISSERFSDLSLDYKLITEKKIPKILHFVWIGDESNRPDDCIDTWKMKNPDWKIKIWGNDLYRETNWINKVHMDAMFKHHLCGVADMMRYEILYREGGITLDADSICLKSLDDKLLDGEAFAVWENEIARPGLICNAAIGSVPRNKFFANIIADIKHEVSVISHHPWITVGPKRLTDSYKKYQYQNLRICPSYYFYPRHFTGLIYNGDDVVYADQKWSSTQKTAPEMFRL